MDFRKRTLGESDSYNLRHPAGCLFYFIKGGGVPLITAPTQPALHANKYGLRPLPFARGPLRLGNGRSSKLGDRITRLVCP